MIGPHILTVDTTSHFEVTTYSHPDWNVISTHVDTPVVGLYADGPYTVIVSSIEPASVSLEEGSITNLKNNDISESEDRDIEEFQANIVSLCRMADLVPTHDIVQSWEYRSSPSITTRGLSLHVPPNMVYIVIGANDATYSFERTDDKHAQESIIGRGEGLVAYRLDVEGCYDVKMIALGEMNVLEAHLFERL